MDLGGRWVEHEAGSASPSLFNLEQSDGHHTPPTVHGTPGCRTPCQVSHDADYGVPALEEMGQDPRRGGSSPLPQQGDSGAHPARWAHGKDSQCFWGQLNEVYQGVRRHFWGGGKRVSQRDPAEGVGGLEKTGASPAGGADPAFTGSRSTPGPVSLHGQLCWREFFYTAGIPNFNRTISNPVCLQVNWDDNL